MPGSESIKQRMDRVPMAPQLPGSTPSPTSTWSAWAPVAAKTCHHDIGQHRIHGRARSSRRNHAHSAKTLQHTNGQAPEACQMIGLGPLRARALQCLRAAAVAPTQRVVASDPLKESGGIGPPQSSGIRPLKLVASDPLKLMSPSKLGHRTPQSGYPDL